MDEDEMKSINESNFYTKAKHRVVLSEVAQIVADQIYNPKFSADGKYLTLVALRDGEIWWEVYSFQNGNLEKMKSEDGYIIDRSTDAKEVYPTDEDGEIKGAPSEQEFEIEVLKETNIISLQLDFTGKKGSKALFSASIDDKMIGTIYEGDVEEGLQTYTFSFPSVSPGMHMFKIHVEPLNKNVRSGINMPSVVPGFKE
jgi:hypothetical protein